MQIDVVDDLRQPEYIGENRCEPCTVLNLIIAAVLGSIIARKSRLGGLLAVGLSVALIYLRGYLVPGTPTLTKRYLPPAVLRWFGKDPEPAVASGLGGAASAAPTDIADGDRGRFNADSSADSDVGVTSYDEGEPLETDGSESASDSTEAHTEPTVADEPAPVDLETLFLEHDILEPCADRDDLCLTADFEADWFDEISDLNESGIDVAAAVDAFGFDADPDEFDLVERDEARRLLSPSGAAGNWPSRAALLADIAASRSLKSWLAEWTAYPPETKGEVLNGLRMFLETCPSGGDVRMGEEVVESCCTSHEVVAVTCEETGERLFEQRLDGVDV
ncbi:hypothetical protein HYG81_10715 [Natrinema zhouii]|uniref:Uncharacterized protein n=1 Tax=Natrinema zhouii TaxID=1710539 RepID=A0A7D6CMB0_9EURY|nr:hypothetical protein [Natrinema zhouii]QLK24597.1 hypothetical protein HYG81_10715 [Natrinema zhouii]